MRIDDVNADAVRHAVSQLGHRFQTKDVSEHPDVYKAHATCRQDRNYHATIGSFLSGNHADLGLTSAGNTPPRGEIWVKAGASDRGPRDSAAGPTATSASSVERLGIGPQYSGDTEFTARMRLHQSWYRSTVLRVPFGSGPRRTDTGFYGNMLDPEAAAAGANFLTAEIFELARGRISQGRGVEPFRCLHNMLSSQPMCFNLFGPLVNDGELATRLLQALLGRDEVRSVERVRIEFAPQPAADYLGDGTSFDAFIEYRRHDGDLAFIGIETKLTDQFSAQPYDRPRYRELTESADSLWLEESWPKLVDIRWNQLWRNQLLVRALRESPGSPYAEGRFMLVHHPMDEACNAIVREYRAFLARPETFIDMPLDELVAKWEPAVHDMSERVWLARFNARYVNLTGSERLYRGLPERVLQRPARAVREGHLRTVGMIENLAAFQETIGLYEAHLGAGNVYFRPTEKGLTVISLEYEACASMIGVSGRDTGHEYLAAIPPTPQQVALAYAGYCAKRDSLRRRSEEERFALRCIRHALRNGLRLPNSDWFFLHQEWRFPSGVDVGKLDLLAVDLKGRRLVVIELKDSEFKATARDRRGRTAAEQAATYADLLVEHRTELYPFFERLAHAMARAYAGAEAMNSLDLDPDLRPITAVWWPDV